MKDLVRIGSETAKGGFANEDIIVKKFNFWKKDREAKKWLEIVGYNLKKIKKVEAIKLHGHKTDVKIKVLVFLVMYNSYIILQFIKWRSILAPSSSG